nr:MAG TPA: hypothetical protein [Bacteriophage sp.]
MQKSGSRQRGGRREAEPFRSVRYLKCIGWLKRSLLSQF